MSVIFLLVGLSVGLIAVVSIVFVCSVRSGQFDDLSGPAYRILSDDDEDNEPPTP